MDVVPDLEPSAGEHAMRGRRILDRDDAFHPDLRYGHRPQEPRYGRLPGTLRVLGARGRHVREVHGSYQKVVAKAGYRIVGPNGRGVGSHLSYLQHDKTLEGEQRARLFGPNGPESAEKFRERSAQDPRFFTVILSPEHGDRMHMVRFTMDV